VADGEIEMVKWDREHFGVWARLGSGRAKALLVKGRVVNIARFAVLN